MGMLTGVLPPPDHAAGAPRGTRGRRPDDGVSVVIRTLDEQRALPATLAAIRAQAGVGPVEVVVVDSGSTDATRDIAAAAGARVIRLAEAYRPGYASNTGIAAARFDVAVLLSASAFPAGPGWLAALLAPLGDPAVAAAFGRQRPVVGVSPIEETFLARTFTSTTTTATFSATNAAIRRDVWRAFPFDETIASGGPDDRDWWARVTAAGHQVRYAGDSVVHRSHALELAGWFYRLREDARAERAIQARHGRSTAPTGSPLGLGVATLADLLRDRRWRDVGRYAVMAPVLAGARLQATRLDAPGERSRLIDLLGVVDRRLFAPRARAARAMDAFLSDYWARVPEEAT